jgi:hypothetical protein
VTWESSLAPDDLNRAEQRKIAAIISTELQGTDERIVIRSES